VDACVPFYGVYDLTRDASGPGPFGPDMVTMLEKMVFKVKIADYRDLFEAASPTYRVTPSAPPMFVLHGANDTLVPVTVAREFVARLREVSQAPVAYVELPCAQHAFDVLASIRCSHTSVGRCASSRASGAGSPLTGRVRGPIFGGKFDELSRSARQGDAFMT